MDSRGSFTVSGILTLSNGEMFETAIPNRISENKYAAIYIDTARSIKYINDLIAPKLVGANPLEYRQLDSWLMKADPTERKDVLGVNTVFLVSLLIYKAAAKLQNLELYVFLNKIFTEHFGRTDILRLPAPIYSMIAGGHHGSMSLSFQEFSVLFSTSLNYSQSLQKALKLYAELFKVFQYRNIFSGVGNDGAYVPNLSSNIDALEILKEAISKTGDKVGLDIYFMLDAAASFLYKGGRYYMNDEVGNYDSTKLLEMYEKLFKEYRFLVLEDPFTDDDSRGWSSALQKMGDRSYIVGDDLISMNKTRLEKAIKEKLCSTVNIKVSQKGTIWEILEFIGAVRKANMKVLISQAAAESNESFIADLAVAVQAEFVKFGAPVRGERVAKHNRLLAIERHMALSKKT